MPPYHLLALLSVSGNPHMRCDTVVKQNTSLTHLRCRDAFLGMRLVTAQQSAVSGQVSMTTLEAVWQFMCRKLPV